MSKIEIKKAKDGPQTDMVLDLANVLKNKTDELRKTLNDNESLSVIALFIPIEIAENEEGNKSAIANSGIHLDLSRYDKKIIASTFFKMFTDNTTMFDIFDLLTTEIANNMEDIIIKMLKLKLEQKAKKNK